MLNAKGLPFSWSYSSLTDFEGCPARYAAKKFFCTTVEPPTEATEWGTRVHTAFEERIRDGKAFDKDLAMYEPWAKALEKIPGERHVEREFKVERGTGYIDLLVVDNDVAVIVDYKTGKKKTDDTQLRLYCWFVANDFPNVKLFKYRYIWLKDNTATGSMTLKGDIPGIRDGILKRVDAMETAWKEKNFPCFPSGLCNGWCPVEECKHWFQRRK